MTTGGSDDDRSWKWDGSASKLDDFNKNDIVEKNEMIREILRPHD